MSLLKSLQMKDSLSVKSQHDACLFRTTAQFIRGLCPTRFTLFLPISICPSWIAGILFENIAELKYYCLKVNIIISLN